MRRKPLWSDAEIDKAAEPAIFDLDYLDLAKRIRDDLARRLISTQRAAWRVLRANATLRQKYEDMLQATGHACQMAYDAVAELEKDNAALKAQLAAASQPERVPDGEYEFGELRYNVKGNRYVSWRQKNRRNWRSIILPKQWVLMRDLPAQGEG